MNYDVAVIGAGPAGATAARKLAQQNLRVVLLEKFKLPRYKPCGGGLTIKAMKLLDFDISATLEDTSREVLFSFDSGPTLQYLRPETVVWLVMRDKFDYLLTQQAVAAGAELRTSFNVERVEQDESGVTLRTATESLRARFVVGADGANGTTAKSLGLMAQRHNGVALEGEIQVSPAAQEKWRGKMLFDFGGIPWGYSWIFPKAEHLSIGVGAWYHTGAVKPREYLARFIARQPDLREHGNLLIKGHVLPLGGRIDRFDQGRGVVAGDAAATADPFFGEGISFAIRSGQLAAEEIAAALARGDGDLRRYTQRVNAEMNDDFRYARLATHIFYRWPRFSYRTLVQGHVLSDDMIRVVEGKDTYKHLMLKAVQSAPKLLWNMLRPAGAGN